MVYIDHSSAELDKWSNVTELKTDEDVATLLYSYEQCIHSVKPENIIGMVERSGFYACVVNTQAVCDFDLFPWLNSLYASKGNTEINCANARFLFPKSISRGEFVEEVVVKSDGGTGDLTEDDNDQVPTGFLDEDDLLETAYLLHSAVGVKIPIEDEDGVIIGRSSSKAEYTVDNIMLSRVHARVYMVGSKYMVEDLHSQNGTYIGKLKVLPGKDREIHVGDSLRLADEEFKLV